MVDLEARGFAVLFDHFIDAGRAIALGGLVPGGEVDADRDILVLQRQVDELILSAAGGGLVTTTL